MAPPMDPGEADSDLDIAPLLPWNEDLVVFSAEIMRKV